MGGNRKMQQNNQSPRHINGEIFYTKMVQTH